MLDGTVVNVALVRIGAELGASMADLQWITNGYLLALASLILLGGSLGDRYGRRRVFVIGVAWFTVASVACGLAQTPGQLITARVLQGVGGALLTPGSLALIQASFRREDRAHGDRRLVGPRRGRGRHRPLRRRLARGVRILAVGLPAQRAARHRHRLGGPGVGAREPRRAGVAPLRRRRAHCSRRAALGLTTFALIQHELPRHRPRPRGRRARARGGGSLRGRRASERPSPRAPRPLRLAAVQRGQRHDAARLRRPGRALLLPHPPAADGPRLRTPPVRAGHPAHHRAHAPARGPGWDASRPASGRGCR